MLKEKANTYQIKWWIMSSTVLQREKMTIIYNHTHLWNEEVHHINSKVFNKGRVNCLRRWKSNFNFYVIIICCIHIWNYDTVLHMYLPSWCNLESTGKRTSVGKLSRPVWSSSMSVRDSLDCWLKLEDLLWMWIGPCNGLGSKQSEYRRVV